MLKILLWASAMSLLAGGLFAPIYAIFVEQIGGNLVIAGTSYGIFSIAAGVLMFFISKWEDRVKHQERLIILGYLLSCIGYVGYFFIKEPWHLFVVQVIFGIGTAITSPAYDGIYSKNLDKGKFVSEWGFWESMRWIVTAVAASIGGYLASLYGFRFLFAVMFIISLIGFFITTLLVKNKR